MAREDGHREPAGPGESVASRGPSRRDFLRSASSAVAGAGVTAAACRSQAKRRQAAMPAPPAAVPASPATVVLVRDRDALDARGRPRARVIARMLDDAMVALTGRGKADQAWRDLLRPDDLVGIKTNEWSHLPTPTVVEAALQRGVQLVGIPAERIRITDRGARRLLRDCTALINTRPLRTHHWAGVGGCLKNYIPFVERPWEYHGDSCANLGALWNLPLVRGKTRLNVLVMLTPLFHGRGPHHFNRRYLWPYRGLLVSRDPVAADAIGVRILEAQRRRFFGAERPFATLAKHVQVAARRHRVGIADPKRIRLITLGWKEDLLLGSG